MTIRHGTLHDGVGRAQVAAYLAEAASNEVVSRFTTAPTVRVVAGTTARERRIVSDAIETVNLFLPLDMRIGVPVTGRSAGTANTINVEFLPCAEYSRCGRAAATTFSAISRDAQGEQTSRRADIQFSRDSHSYGDDERAHILMVHELLHALGVDNHVSTRFASIMQASNHYAFATISTLAAIDREALRALYGRLDPGDDPTDFGPWSSTTVHLVGDGPHADFGVALRNGYAEPWVSGAEPRTTLSGNSTLTGTVTWAGALLGFSAERPVAGDASIAVRLGTLTGAADFTALESWAAGSAPGAAGTGAVWLDGDLGYSIAVAGNTFRETGGDAGRLTGIFTGAAHEGAAGTLERSDLTAAFGASR